MSQIERLITKHGRSISQIEKGTLDELPDDAYQDFYEFYLNCGDMPYGVAKARDGDPIQWVNDRVIEDAESYRVF